MASATRPLFVGVGERTTSHSSVGLPSAPIRPMKRSTGIIDGSLLEVQPAALSQATVTFSGRPIFGIFCIRSRNLPGTVVYGYLLSSATGPPPLPPKSGLQASIRIIPRATVHGL